MPRVPSVSNDAGALLRDWRSVTTGTIEGNTPTSQQRCWHDKLGRSGSPARLECRQQSPHDSFTPLLRPSRWHVARGFVSWQRFAGVAGWLIAGVATYIRSSTSVQGVRLGGRAAETAEVSMHLLASAIYYRLSNLCRWGNLPRPPRPFPCVSDCRSCSLSRCL